MLAENKVGRGGMDIFLRHDCAACRAQPALDFNTLIAGEGVIGEIVGPSGRSPPTPPSPLGLGFDVELFVMWHLLTGLSDESLTHVTRVIALARQRIGECVLNHRVVFLR